MNIENRKKNRNRGFNFYRRYYLGFGFIAGIMILALTIDLVKALSLKTADVEEKKVATETLSTSPVSVTNPEDLVSGCSLSNLVSMKENVTNNNLVAGLSLTVSKLTKYNLYLSKNDTEILTTSYEDVKEKVIEDTEQTEKEKEKVKKDNEKAIEDTEKTKKEKKKSSVPNDELQYKLAKLIDAEGSIVGDYSQQLIAYCFLNRMLSNHWANSFDGVLNDGRGYHPRTCKYVSDPTKKPSDKALKNAQICLNNYYSGTMPVPYNLVFQAGFKQGTTYYYDESYGIYFCLADKLEPNE